LKPEKEKIPKRRLSWKNFFPEENFLTHVPHVPHVPAFAFLAIQRAQTARRAHFLAADVKQSVARSLGKFFFPVKNF